MTIAAFKADTSSDGLRPVRRAAYVCVGLASLALSLYLTRTLTPPLLMWLEGQDSLVVYLIFVLLFVVTSFPISVGYIVVVIAVGYVFGVAEGLVLTVLGAAVGAFVAHEAMRLLGLCTRLPTVANGRTTQALLTVVSGPLKYKIVFCSRLTPIPFGLQNLVFALSNITGVKFYLFTLLGLLPGQLVGICVGASLRSMKDVLDDSRISTFTYLLALLQLILAGGIMIWLGSKARKELGRALSEAESLSSLTNNNIV